MKKLSLTLAFVLCLVLCVLAIASCGKDKAPKDTTPTACAHEWGEYYVEAQATCSAAGMKVRYCTKCKAPDPEGIEIPKVAHTESEDYRIVSEPTCSDEGWEAKYCTVCKATLDATLTSIPADPAKHVVKDEDWVWDSLTLLNQTGNKTGRCEACGTPLSEPIEYEGLSVWNSNDKNSGNKVDKRTYQSIRGEDHFCPDESNNNQGNDLLIEFSILYNETLLDNSDRTFDITIGDGSDFINLKLGSNANARYGTVVGGFSARNRSGDGMTLIYPTSEMIAADPDAKYPSIGAYGWHRVGVRVHEEANIVSDNVRYTLIGTLYLDGEPVLEFDLSTWANNNSNANALLYTATIENDQLVYTDNDASTRSWGEFGIYGFYGATDVYLGIADAYMTCGKTFVQQVEENTTPDTTATFTFDNGTPDDTTDDLTCPAAIYYKFIET